MILLKQRSLWTLTWLARFTSSMTTIGARWEVQFPSSPPGIGAKCTLAISDVGEESVKTIDV